MQSRPDLIRHGDPFPRRPRDEDMHRAHPRGGAAGAVEELDRENDRTPAGSLDRGVQGKFLARPHGEKKIRLRPPDWRGVPGGSEPRVPPARCLPDQVLHRLVGQGQEARIKNHPGRIGIAEGEGFSGLENFHRSPGRPQGKWFPEERPWAVGSGGQSQNDEASGTNPFVSEFPLIRAISVIRG